MIPDYRMVGNAQIEMRDYDYGEDYDDPAPVTHTCEWCTAPAEHRDPDDPTIWYCEAHWPEALRMFDPIPEK